MARLSATAHFVALALAPAAPLSAQTATVAVSHDDPDGIILPGQTVRINAIVSWFQPGGGATLAGVRGGTISSPPLGAAVGHASEVLDSDFTPGGLVYLGTPVGGSMLGADIAGISPHFMGGLIIPPWWSNTGILIHAFDWTAPSDPLSLGEYRFNFVAPAIAPNVRLYPTIVSPAWIEAPTTYLGTHLTVIPAPAPAALLLAASTFPTRRRR